MSNSRFIPERYCTFSAQLAATIGLEEAVLLQDLSHQLGVEGGQNTTISIPTLAEFPFWDEVKLNQLLQRLVDLGIISATPTSDPAVWSTRRHQRSETPKVQNTETWRPSEHVIDLLNLNHGLTRDRILSQLKTFDRSGDPKDMTVVFDSTFYPNGATAKSTPLLISKSHRSSIISGNPALMLKKSLRELKFPHPFMKASDPSSFSTGKNVVARLKM